MGFAPILTSPHQRFFDPNGLVLFGGFPSGREIKKSEKNFIVEFAELSPDCSSPSSIRVRSPTTPTWRVRESFSSAFSVHHASNGILSVLIPRGTSTTK